MARIDLSGQRFGKLTAIEDVGQSETGNYRMWRCRCDCGTETLVRSSSLRLGRVRSCGCARRHGRSRTGTYKSWQMMRQRCENIWYDKYVFYGGRGVTVCERWRDFKNFLADMGDRPDGMTLDRIDARGNYEPGNCRWATLAQQKANTRRSVGYRTLDGERITVKAMAHILAMKESQLYSLLVSRKRRLAR